MKTKKKYSTLQQRNISVYMSLVSDPVFFFFSFSYLRVKEHKIKI